MTARTSSAESAGSASDDRGRVGDRAGREPAARRTAVVGDASFGGLAEPDEHQERGAELLAGRDLEDLADLAGHPEGGEQRPEAAAVRRATSSPPGATVRPLPLCTTPTTTASQRVFAGLALRRV